MMREQDVRQWIGAYLADLLDLTTEEISPDREFDSYGLDSADAIIIGGALEDRFDTEVDATVFLRNSTIDGLIEDLRVSGLLG